LTGAENAAAVKTNNLLLFSAAAFSALPFVGEQPVIP